MTVIHIPTLEQAEGGALGRLFRSRKWEKAALVWAFTINEGRGGDQRSNRKTEVRFPMPMAEFAAQGYSGLSSEQTVAHYRKAWQLAIDAGKACSVEPGDRIDEPDMDWPPNPDPSLHPAGYESAQARAEEIRRLAEVVGGARGAIRAATSAPNTLRVVAQTATDDQAQALAEGLRRRGVDRSESYVQSLNAEQVREALDDPDLAKEVMSDTHTSANVSKAQHQVWDQRTARAKARNDADPAVQQAERVIAVSRLLEAIHRLPDLIGALPADLTDGQRESLGLGAESLDQSAAALRELLSTSAVDWDAALQQVNGDA